MIKKISLLIGLLALLQGYGAAVFGTVTDSKTDSTLAGVKIILHNAEAAPGVNDSVGGALSSNNGSYSISGIGNGSYRITASVAGYYDAWVSIIIVQDNKDVQMDFSMDEFTYSTVNGTVLSSANEDPIPGTKVWLIKMPGNDEEVEEVIDSTLADSVGSYKFTDVQVGNGYKVRAAASGYNTGNNGTFTLVADVPEIVDIEMLSASSSVKTPVRAGGPYLFSKGNQIVIGGYGENSVLRMYSIRGDMVHKTVLAAGQNTIDLPFAVGTVLLIKVGDTDGSKAHKIVLK